MSQIPPPLPAQTLQYATPVAPLANAAWRRAGQLVVPVRSQLPPVCVKCNAPEARRYRKDVYWHEPWVYVLILPGLLIYAIVALILRKNATYECGLCAAHVSRRKTHLLVVWGLVLIGFVAMVLGIMAAAESFGSGYEDLFFLVPIGILVMITGAIYAAFALPILKPKRIDEQYAYFVGAGAPFLQQLPEA